MPACTLVHEVADHAVIPVHHCSLLLKGGEKEDLVACTADHTYSMTLVESSNSMFLVHQPTATGGGAMDSSIGGIIEGCVEGHFEVGRLPPNNRPIDRAKLYNCSCCHHLESADKAASTTYS